MEKNKEPGLRILDLKNRFTFKERLSPEISGLKERLKFFSNFEIFWNVWNFPRLIKEEEIDGIEICFVVENEKRKKRVDYRALHNGDDSE